MFGLAPLPPDADSMPCRELTALWLHCFCSNATCNGVATHTLAALVARHHCENLPLRRVIRRLRCRRCGAKPVRVLLVKKPERDASLTWRGSTRDVLPVLGP